MFISWIKNKLFIIPKLINNFSFNKIVDKLLTIILLILLIFLTIKFFFQSYTINGDSMFPTYNNGEIVSINTFQSIKNKCSKNSYQRGDVILVYQKYIFGNILIKRIVAVPGDTICIKDGYLYINGKKEKGDYPKMSDAGLLSNGYEITLQDNEYFFLGDNRNNSVDSRVLGIAKSHLIISKINEQRSY